MKDYRIGVELVAKFLNQLHIDAIAAPPRISESKMSAAADAIANRHDVTNPKEQTHD